MLTALTTIKSRLALLDSDTSYDALLTNAIKSLSARFDKETNRTLARTENATGGRARILVLFHVGYICPGAPHHGRWAATSAN
jgi:hypothetical protein